MTDQLEGNSGLTDPPCSLPPTRSLLHDENIEVAVPPSTGNETSDWGAPHSIPKACRVNSQNNFTYDRSPPLHRWRRIADRIHRIWGGLWRLGKQKSDRFLSSKHANSQEHFVREIRVELLDKNGRREVWHAQALIDTGNPMNFLSLDFAEKFNLDLKEHSGKAVLQTMGNNEWISIGRIKGRLTFSGTDLKFLEAEFQVSSAVEQCDVVIGSKTIVEYGLVQLDSRLPPACSGFRSDGSTYTPAEIKEAEQKRKDKQTANEVLKQVLEGENSGTRKPSPSKG